MTEDEALAELIAAFCRGEFDGLRRDGAVFTLDRLPARSVEELSPDAQWLPDTLARRAVYWTAQEYAGFIARFWGLDPRDIDLPDLGTDEERLRWLAALPIALYPPVARGLLGRLHI